MKASILSLLITLLILSVTPSSYACETHTKQLLPSLYYEVGERLGSDISPEDSDTPYLASQEHNFRIFPLLLDCNPLPQCLNSLYSHHFSIRAPPQLIIT